MDEVEPPAGPEFGQLIQEALDSLPDDLRSEMSNVEILVEDEPPPGQPLLGLYQGVPLTRRGINYSGALPDKITIYQGPLERIYGHDPELFAARSSASSCTRSRTTSASATSGSSRSTATERNQTRGVRLSSSCTSASPRSSSRSPSAV